VAPLKIGTKEVEKSLFLGMHLKAPHPTIQMLNWKLHILNPVITGAKFPTVSNCLAQKKLILLYLSASNILRALHRSKIPKLH
jgi:hypothetical protein